MTESFNGDGEISCAELDRRIVETLRDLQDDIDTYDEQAAIREDAMHDGKTTTDRALQALEEPDTSWGKHAVAKAWLRNYAINARVFRRVL